MPNSDWHWPHFKPEEIACKGDGSILIIPEALDKLELLRKEVGRPLIINSAYRSPSYNKEIGGSHNSQHLLGLAFDISLKGHDREIITKCAQEVGFMGVGQYDTFIHVDGRQNKARWDYRSKK